MANAFGYVEHQLLEVAGFRVVDATATGDRPHDDVVWVGHGGMAGQWLSPEDAISLAAAISSVVVHHLVRRGKCDLSDAHRRVQSFFRTSVANPLTTTPTPTAQVCVDGLEARSADALTPCNVRANDASH